MGSSASHGVRILNCDLDSDLQPQPTGGTATGAPIKNAGVAWLISGCNFEGRQTSIGNPLPAVAYLHDATTPALGLSFVGCWFGDDFIPCKPAANGTWIRAMARGLNIMACFFGTDPAAGTTLVRLKQGCGGVVLTGNQFSGSLPSVVVDGPIDGLVVYGNLFAPMETAPITVPGMLIPAQIQLRNLENARSFALLGNAGLINDSTNQILHSNVVHP